MNTLRLLLIVALLLEACTSRSNRRSADAACDVIPEAVAGIWTSEDAVLNERLLVEGVAVYLRSDGLGGIVGGPPPLGYQIYASYSQGGVLDYEMVEYGETVGTGQLQVNPTLETLTLEDRTLRRRFSQVNDATLLALGVRQEDVARCGEGS